MRIDMKTTDPTAAIQLFNGSIDSGLVYSFAPKGFKDLATAEERREDTCCRRVVSQVKGLGSNPGHTD